MISSIISRLVILLFGTLYPAYASYKAVKTKNVKEYVKWMMYWIVFALFTCTETFTDIFLSWFPFYYEIKIILVIWLLSPATKGSSILYRKFVHPMLSSREQEIDDYISKAKEQSYRQVLDLGQKGVSVLMQTAIKSVSTQKLVSALSQSSVVEQNESDGAGSSRTASVKNRVEVERYQMGTGGYAGVDDGFILEDDLTITEDDEMVEVPQPKVTKGGKGKGKKGGKSNTKGTKRTTRSKTKTDDGESSDF